MFGETIESMLEAIPDFYKNKPEMLIMYAMSILSDAQELAVRDSHELARCCINKAKYFMSESMNLIQESELRRRPQSNDELHLGIADIVVTGESGANPASISSALLDDESDPSKMAGVNAIETMILGHYSAGVNVMNTQYLAGLKSVLERIDKQDPEESALDSPGL
nr:hypothetical protein [Methylomarinum sp. Ch1-1]MDP4518968.1 hypothetical protein [Methylomarinum sp. Ch1-1]MDP4523366.1 hypothetical protein [Methylomarinum sp. Ch1-1]